MPYLLNLVYLLLLVVGSPWLLYGAIKKGKYREGWAAKFLGRVPRREGSRRCVWLHAVSVGEVNLLQTLLTWIEREHPDWECVVSTTTKTGYDLARQKYAPRTVFYCPLDFTWAVAEALRRVRPDLLILTELELWPNLIGAARRHGVKVAIVNGRLSEKSFHGYRRIKWLAARSLHSLDLVAVQNEEYAGRFRDLGARAESVHITGSLKFDGANTDRNNPATRRLAALAGIAPGDVVLLAGSTQHPEESLALEAFRTLCIAHPRLRLILVPRHPERFEETAALLDRWGLAWQHRSRLEAESANPQARILLVDAVGELGAWWGTAHIAFVGGSLGRRGGQNMLEPAAYGAAVSFGPNTWNFKDIVANMLAARAACVVNNGAELTAFVERCLVEPGYAAALGERAKGLVENQLGAAERSMELLSELVTRSLSTERTRRAAA